MNGFEDHPRSRRPDFPATPGTAPLACRPGTAHLPVLVVAGVPAIARPRGVSILALVQMAAGTLLIGGLCFAFTNLELVEPKLRGLGFSAAGALALTMLGAAYLVLAALGMWFGTRWGWWLAAVCYASEALRSLLRLLAVLLAAAGGADDEWGVILALTLTSVRLLVVLLIVCYLFTTNVLCFFRLHTVRKPAALAVVLGAAAAMIGLVWMLSQAWTVREAL